MTVTSTTRKPTAALTEESHRSRRVTTTRQEAMPGKEGRDASGADRPSRSTAPRDAVQLLARLYCELGTVTFDFVDGRVLSHAYSHRRAVLCAEIRRQLTAMRPAKGSPTR